MKNFTSAIGKFPTRVLANSILLFIISFLIQNTLISQTVTKSFGFTGAIETWTVPAGVTSVELEVIGGDGGDGAVRAGGSGAKATATFRVTPGTVLEIVIGEAGQSSSENGGGGGGSGVRIQGATTPLIVAGGGAGGAKGNNSRAMTGGGGLATEGSGNGGDGGGVNGSGGGGGLLTSGIDGTTFDFGNGGQGGFAANGGTGTANGGFGVGGGGGGGTNDVGGGGGGGYTGGDASMTGAKVPNFSTGGGSFINPSASSIRTRGASSRSMPIIAGVMGGGTQMNGMILFSYTAVAIPTFNQWGLLIFGLLVLNLGLIFVYRKSSI